MKYRIIFDMDGTLIDTAVATCKACEREREAFCLPPLDRESVIRAIGIANPKFYEALYPGYPQDLVHAFGREVEQTESEIIRGLGRKLLFPDVLRLLQYLKERGAFLYLASTGDPEHVDAVMSSCDIGRYFEKICCGEPAKVGMVRRLISDSPDDNWVMVGDRHTDSDAARGNGILSIGAAFGYCDAKEQAAFDAVATVPFDIPRLLGIPAENDCLISD